MIRCSRCGLYITVCDCPALEIEVRPSEQTPNMYPARLRADAVRGRGSKAARLREKEDKKWKQ